MNLMLWPVPEFLSLCPGIYLVYFLKQRASPMAFFYYFGSLSLHDKPPQNSRYHYTIDLFVILQFEPVS